MATPGWWETHRLLEAGSRGADVKELQANLNDWSTSKIPVTGVFDAATVNSVKAFQQQFGLKPDGIVGPLTYSMITQTNYRFMIDEPEPIKQKKETCWAASYESAFHSSWLRGRTHPKVADLLATYHRFLNPTVLPPGTPTFGTPTRGDITLDGFLQIASDFHLTAATFDATDFRLEAVLAELGRPQGQHIILVHDAAGGNVAHAVVLFGVRVTEGSPNLLFMDPIDADTHEMDLQDLRKATRLVVVSARALTV